MNDHYFSEEPTSPHNERIIDFSYKGHSLSFKTDSGVFSKERIDPGSKLLLDTIGVLTQERILDLGCGYGVIGVSIAKAYPSVSMEMVDINKRAVELATVNIGRNTLHNCIARQSDGFSGLQCKYDLILTNPPIRAGKKVVYGLFTEAKDHLKDKGSLYVVIQKKQGANSAINFLKEIYGNCTKVNKAGGYWVFQSLKENSDGRNL